MRFYCLPSNKIKKAKNERYIDFTFDPGSVDFLADVAICRAWESPLELGKLVGPDKEKKTEAEGDQKSS